MTPQDIEHVIQTGFPDDPDATRIEVLSVEPVRLRLAFEASMLRPGGSLSGPALMKLADTAMWAAAMHACGGPTGLYTSSLQIDFLRLPTATDLLAETTLLKVGRTLIVGTVALRNDGDERLVAHASVTYARSGA